MKIVKYLVSSTPDNPVYGYGDHVEITENGQYLYGNHASTCPNAFKLNVKGSPAPWNLYYAWPAPMETVWKCIIHKSSKPDGVDYGKCLIINNGNEIPTRNPNVNQGGRNVAKGIFVHCGALRSVRKDWRGSKGCCTIPPDDWINFIENFTIGETGIFIIEDFIHDTKGIA